MWQFLTAIFAAITGVSKAVEKGLPSEKVQESIHEIKKERLTVKERRMMINKSRVYLRLHPKQSISAHVEVVYDSLSDEDKQDIITALKELFPKRK